jgi:hypothetical protein
VTFALTLDSAPSSAVTVNYVTATGTAGTSDYTSTSGTVTFAAGQTAQFVNIATTEDSAFEADETFTVTFSGSSLTASVTATGTITNDDVDTANQAQSFTLSSAANSYTGGAGSDTFSGTAGTVDSDVLVGGEGSDTLTLTVDNAEDNNAAFSATGIENLSIRTTATAGGVTLDVGDVTGVETLTANRLLTALTLTDVQDIANIVVDRNVSNANLTVTYGADVVSGTSDEVTITVTNSANAGTVTVDGIETVNLVSNDNPTDDTNEIRIDAAGTGTATEVLNISGAGDLTVVATDALTINNSASGEVDLTATAATEINNSGSGDVTITATAATAVNHTGSGDMDVTTGAAVDVTIDAASASGSITVTANGAGDLDITGSAQDDTIDMLDTLDNADVIDGGDGADALLVTLAGAGTLGAVEADIAVSNVETLSLTSSTNGDSIDFDVFANPDEIATVIVTSDDNGDDVTLTDVQASTYTIRNATTGNTANDMDFVTIDLKDSSGDEDSITINLQNRNDEEAFTLTTLTAAGVETINLNATTEAEAITVTTLTAAALETLNISGDADLTITNALGTSVTSVSAAGFTGALDIRLGVGAVSVTAGSGDDSIRFGTTLGSTDSVSGGDGDDTVFATLSAGTVAPTLADVETLSATFAGGALSGVNLGAATTTLNIVDASAAAVATNLKSTVTTINQQGGSAGASALNLSYATGAAAVVSYGIADATENVANASTTFGNIANLTVAGGDGDEAATRTLALGSLIGGAALTALTVTSGDDANDTVNTGAITAAALKTLTVTAGEANVTLGAFAAATALTTLSLTSTGAGDIAVGNLTTGTALTSVTITATDDASVDLGNINASTSTLTAFTVTLDGTYGTSDFDVVTAKTINALKITAGADGTTLSIENFALSGNMGTVTIDAEAGFDGLTNFIDTAATTGTVGNMSLTAGGAMTIADGAGEILINDAITVGNITLTTTDTGSMVLGLIDDATTIGNLTVNAEGNVTWTGADAVTTMGDIAVTVADGVTVDLGTIGAGGTVGTITASGEGDVTLTIGAVASMGTIDFSGLTGDSTLTLNASTTIGVVFTGGEGGDDFIGTGGADVITAGEGSDTITGGGGADTIDLTESTAAIDNVVITDDDAVDVVTGWSADDVIQIDVSDINTEIGQNLVDSADDVAAADPADFLTLSSGDTVAAAAVAATDNIVFFDDVTGIDSFADLDFDITLDANFGNAGDKVIVVFYDEDDGVARVGYMGDAGAAADANLADATTTFVELVNIQLTGAQYSALTAANFAFI